MNTIGKQHFISLYCPARERAFTKKSILSSWSKAGLLPLNPDRVLRDLPDPLNDSSKDAFTVPAASLQATYVSTPVTPATPVSTEAFVSLQNLLVNENVYTPEQQSTQRFQRLLHKLSKAAQTFLAKNALQQDQIKFLLTINNEAKARRSTKSLVLGKAKVMSYEDLVEARARREKTKAAKENKSKKKRKRDQEQEGESDMETPKPKVARSSEMPTGATERVGEIPVAEGVVMLQPGRAPVARMY